MVCQRCIKVVREELQKLGIEYNSVQLGEVELAGEISAEKLEKLRATLLENGFELIDDSKTKLIEEVKTLIIKTLQSGSVLLDLFHIIAHSCWIRFDDMAERGIFWQTS